MIRQFASLAMVVALLIPAQGHADAFDDSMDLSRQHYRSGSHDSAADAAKDAMRLAQEIAERGPLDLANAAHQAGRSLWAAGRLREATSYIDQALEIRRDSLGASANAVANSLNLKALVAKGLGDLSTAASLYEQASAIYAANYHAEHAYVLVVNVNQGHVLYDQGRIDDAAKLAERSIPLIEALEDKRPWLEASAWQLLGNTRSQFGNVDAASQAYLRARDILEAEFGEGHPELFEAMRNHGFSVLEAGRYAEGLAILAEARDLSIDRGGAQSELYATATSSLSAGYARLGQYVEARRLASQSADLFDALLGPRHLRTASARVNQGSAALKLGRSQEALSILTTAAGIIKNNDVRRPMVEAKANSHLAEALIVAGNADEALDLVDQSSTKTAALLGDDHWIIGRLFRIGGDAAMARNETDKAADFYQRSIAQFDNAFGEGHPETLPAALGLARASLKRGDLRTSRDIMKKAERSIEYLGRTGSLLESSLALERARLERMAGDNDAALAAIRDASASARNSSRRGSQSPDGVFETPSEIARDIFAEHIDILVDMVAQRPELADEIFEVAQYAGTSKAAEAIAFVPALQLAPSGPASALLQDRQDLLQRRRIVENRATSISGPAALNESLQRAKELASLDRNIADIEKQIWEEFPEWSDYISPQPISVEQAQALVGADDALFGVLLDKDRSFAWVLTNNTYAVQPVNLGTDAFKRLVQELRQGLDLGYDFQIKPYDLDKAHDLHQLLIEPFRAQLESKKHIVFVPDRSLSSLPLGLLVTEKPVQGQDYAQTAWLLRSHAITVLPSVAALQTFEQMGERPDNLAFLGVGNPVYGDGPAGSSRSAVDLEDFCLDADTLAPGALSVFPPLPETERELQTIANMLGPERGHLLLGDQANEQSLRDLDLRGFGVVAFATHGLLPGELPCQSEPALVLTPSGGEPSGDGLLTASEITRLRLDADLVLLSACNTAGPDGASGGESLSGLARAFFRAGARSLMVTHWAVETFSTERITTGFTSRVGQGQNRAEALRTAQLDVAANPDTAHPFYWGAFALVGDS